MRAPSIEIQSASCRLRIAIVRDPDMAQRPRLTHQRRCYPKSLATKGGGRGPIVHHPERSDHCARRVSLMPWFNVDDGLADHPKADDAGNAALGLWVRLGSYCAKHLTDGFVRTEAARRYGTPDQLARLVKAGFLRKVRGGYEMHDYLDRNRSKAQVEAEREAAKQRMQSLRSRRDVTPHVRPNSRRNNGRSSTAQSVLSEQEGGGERRAAPPTTNPKATCEHGCPLTATCVECRGLRVVSE